MRYAFAGYIDVNGRSKSKAVPIAHLPELLAGHERYTPRGLGGLGAMNAAEDECVAVPDPATLVVLPWDRRVAWMSADLWFGGREPFALCPRSILKRQVEAAADAGYDFLRRGRVRALHGARGLDRRRSGTSNRSRGAAR